MDVQCHRCQKQNRCELEPAIHRVTFFCGFDRTPPACFMFVPAWCRGVEGVLPCASPRPGQAVLAMRQRS